MEEEKQRRREEQAEQIEEQKAELQASLMWQIFFSFLVSAAFYGIVLYQNPDLKPNDN